MVTKLGPWLEATLRVIGAEAGGARLGGDLIALKMSEAIFAQAIRALHRAVGRIEVDCGVAGFADPHLGTGPCRRFTARPTCGLDCGDSLPVRRDCHAPAFAERFTGRFGCYPDEPMSTSWRMQIAREALATRGLSVAETAEISGYASESAFSRVFKKEIGLSPAAFRTKGVQPQPV